MLKYSLFHTWVKQEHELLTFKIGLTKYILSTLGKVNYVGLPKINEKVQKGAVLVILETSKSAIEVYSPISGVVLKVNLELGNSVDLFNKDPEGLGWLCSLASTENDIAEANLLSYEEYYSKNMK